MKATPEEQQIADLQRQIGQLQKELSLARKHLRDSYMGAILTGLAVNWKPVNGESAQSVADLAERLLEAVLRNRKRWESGESPNVAPKPLLTKETK